MVFDNLKWRKPSRSNESGDNCVELAELRQFIAVRDSKDPEGPKLIVGHADFHSLMSTLKNL